MFPLFRYLQRAKRFPLLALLTAIALFGAVVWADTPAAGEQNQREVTRDTEKHRAGDLAVEAFIDRVGSMGPAWREQLALDVHTNKALAKKVAVCLDERLALDDLGDLESQDLMSVCLYVLQVVPVDGSIEILDKLAMSAQVLDAIRLEAFAAMCKQSNGIDHVRQKVNLADDRTRAAAVRALARVQNGDETARLLADLKQRKTDFTGTQTGSAIGEAQSVLELYRDLAAMPFDAQLTYLLGNLPYQGPPPPARPQLGRDPVSVFIWSRLVTLWKQDPAQVRKVSQEYKATNPGRRQWVDQLLDDLPTKAD
jgi:hypothetical protein